MNTSVYSCRYKPCGTFVRQRVTNWKWWHIVKFDQAQKFTGFFRLFPPPHVFVSVQLLHRFLGLYYRILADAHECRSTYNPYKDSTLHCHGAFLVMNDSTSAYVDCYFLAGGPLIHLGRPIKYRALTFFFPPVKTHHDNNYLATGFLFCSCPFTFFQFSSWC